MPVDNKACMQDIPSKTSHLLPQYETQIDACTQIELRDNQSRTQLCWQLQRLPRCHNGAAKQRASKHIHHTGIPKHGLNEIANPTASSADEGSGFSKAVGVGREGGDQQGLGSPPQQYSVTVTASLFLLTRDKFTQIHNTCILLPQFISNAISIMVKNTSNPIVYSIIYS